jgi:hypothetical protein
LADSTTIKEFLVSLGFKTDESSMKKFTGGIKSVTKSVLVLGATIEAVTLTVAYGVARMASNLEQLYFSARRTSSSADQLTAFGLAARNFGASIEEARGSVEGLAAFMRNNPGSGSFVSGLLGSMGLSARDVNGQLLTGTALTLQLGKMFAKLKESNQWYRANQIAGQLGISDNTALAMADPGFEAEQAREERRVKGMRAAADAAHAFEKRFNDFKQSAKQFSLPFVEKAWGAIERLLPKVEKFLGSKAGKDLIRDLGEAFTWLLGKLGELLSWIDTHGKDIEESIHSIFGQFTKTIDALRPALEWLSDKFFELNKATDGWAAKILVATAALKLMGATGIVTGVVGIAASITKALAAAAIGTAGAAAEGAGWAILAGGAFGVAAAAAIGYALGTLVDKIIPESAKRAIGDTIGHTVDFFKDLLDPAKQAQYAADPKNFYASHYPWEKPPAGAAGAAGGNSVNQKTDIYITGNVTKEVHDKMVASQERLNAALIREFATVAH